MDDKAAKVCGREDTQPAANPTSDGAMATPGQVEDDAWMSLPPPKEGAESDHADKPWPAWSEVEEHDDDSLEAGPRSWAPQPAEPSENLAGWHT
eukprot:2109990-Prorocentrum_lima.AAC.1